MQSAAPISGIEDALLRLPPTAFLGPRKRRTKKGAGDGADTYSAVLRRLGGRVPGGRAHPLLSQPLVEYSLSCATVTLTTGGRDRDFARQAFADHLPAQVINRRSKGNLSAHYSWMAAASLPMLRDLLLDGRLVAAGLVDRERLAAARRGRRLGHSPIAAVPRRRPLALRWGQIRPPNGAALNRIVGRGYFGDGRYNE